MKDTTKTYLRFSVFGAAFGITTSVLSCISHKALNVPLGFSPLTTKNVIKVGALSGGTTAVLIGTEDNWRILTKIENKINQL